MYRRKNYRKKFTKKSYRRPSGYRRKRLIKLIKKVAVKRSELKQKDASYGKVELYHNVYSGGYVLNSTASVPTQGTADNQRVGDEIYTSGVTVRCLFGQKSDRPNVNWKIWFLEVPKGTSFSSTGWFEATTGNVLLDNPNRDFVKVLKTVTMRPDEAGLSNSGGDEYTFVRKWWVPYRRLLKFGPTAGGTSHNQNDLHMIVACYDAYGSLTTDNIAYIQAVSTLYYRDP